MTTIISQADTWVNTDGHNVMHNLSSSYTTKHNHNSLEDGLSLSRFLIRCNINCKVGGSSGSIFPVLPLSMSLMFRDT